MTAPEMFHETLQRRDVIVIESWSIQCHRAKYGRTIRRSINPGTRICRTNGMNRITMGEAPRQLAKHEDTRILGVFGLFFCSPASVKTFFYAVAADRWESDSRKHQGSIAPIVTLWGTRIGFWESYITCRTTKALRITDRYQLIDSHQKAFSFHTANFSRVIYKILI